MSMIIDPKIMPCPICGAKAFVSHDVVDGLDFGWSVGCPRACINDNVHRLNEEEFHKAKLVMFSLPTKQKAIEAWNKRCRGGDTE